MKIRSSFLRSKNFDLISCKSSSRVRPVAAQEDSSVASLNISGAMTRTFLFSLLLCRKLAKFTWFSSIFWDWSSMSKPLNVLFLSSEVDPFAKTGGLADVSSALPQAIKELGHEIRIMMPRYRFISERRYKLHDIIRLKEIPVPVGKITEQGNVKSSFISNLKEKVQVYFLDNANYFGRDGIYQSPVGRKDYKDNDERFIFFCRGVLEALKRLGWQPDIIHCNDWQTGLVPAYLKTVFN